MRLYYLRTWLGKRLRYAADRIDREHAWLGMSYRFTFEEGQGIRFRDDGRGCLMWYRNEEYHRAHDESDTATRRRAEWDALDESAKQTLIKLGIAFPNG